MATTISAIIKFIPTLGGNNEKPEDERIVAHLRAVKIQVKQDQLRKFIDMDPKKLMKEMMDPKQQSEIISLLQGQFVRFDNFNVADETTAQDIHEGKKGVVNGVEKILDTKGEVYERPAVIKDLFELGEYELVMEIFMHMIGSSQLRKPTPPSKVAEGVVEAEAVTRSVTEDREDEEKNSESPSGTTLTRV